MYMYIYMYLFIYMSNYAYVGFRGEVLLKIGTIQ